MSQAILISNNEVINSLYEVNLRAYVATNVTIKENIDSAIQLLEHSPNIDAIICFNQFCNDKSNSYEKLNEYLLTNKLNIPTIVLGIEDKSLKNSINISNRYDIKAILKAMAKILGITAKEMADLKVPEYFPIPLKLFNQVDNAFCDIYFRREKSDFEFEYFKIIEKDQETKGVLEKYLNEGIDHLYIDSDHRLHFINNASAAVVSELERDDVTAEEKLEITQQAMSVLAEEVFAKDVVSERMAELSRACIQSIKETIQDVPKLKKLLKMLLENKGDICYKHSIITTYVATEILKVISWGSEEQASKVAFALFFHDIYLIQIYKKYPDAISEEDILYRDDVDEKDKQIVLEHAKRASQLVKSFPKCPMGADTIILQHHGMTSGEGFAATYKDDISPLTKIMIVSEEVAMTVLEDNAGTSTKIQVNKAEMIQKLTNKFRNNSYTKIIQAFSEIDL